MKPLQVLIIEDSADDAELMVRALRRAGHSTTYERVETPEAMAAALAKGSWDLIIADYSLPHFSGLAALKMVQNQALDLPFKWSRAASARTSRWMPSGPAPTISY